MTAAVTVGSELAGYRIDELIGEGAMAAVYRATQLDLERTVALKLLAPDLAEDDSFRERFKRESRLAAQLEHPNVLPIYEAGEWEGRMFISMRFVNGPDLSVLLQRGGCLAPGHATSIVAQLADALDAAHAKGLVHRDVKPANVLLARRTEGGHCYLADFGLGRRLASDSVLTENSGPVGTLDYIAPEQLQGETVDARADVYSLGCLLYEALTASVPFPRESNAATMMAHLADPPPALGDAAPRLPAALDDVITRALAKNPAERFPSAGELARAALAAADPEDETGSEPVAAAANRQAQG
jgi:serine/threonine protein kinase